MKRNLLHLIPSFHQGGSERQALQLAGLVANEGTYNVSIACLDRSGILFDEALDMGFADVPEFPLSSFYDLNMAKQVRRFVRHLRRNRIDIIQTHDFYTNIFGMLSAWLAGVPVRIAAKRETGMRSRAQLFVERRAFGRANVIVANSQKVRGYLIASGVQPDRVEVISNGIDFRRFEERSGDKCTLRKQFGIEAACSSRLVTIVANLRDPVKNHRMFLRAAAATAERVSDALFVIAGEGELLDGLKAQAADIGIAGRTSFIGRCDSVPDLLSISDVCVLTSDSEGFSNSILEYMAAGKPVVATNVGGAAEAVIEGQTGFLVEPGDHETMATRLCTVLDDHKLARMMGSEGRRRVVENFSTDRQLEKSLAVYSRELREAGKNSRF